MTKFYDAVYSFERVGGLSIRKALHINVWEMAWVTAMAAGGEHIYILPPRTPDIIAHWQVAPPARPPSRWLPHMILTEPCCSFPDIPNMGWHNKKKF